MKNKLLCVFCGEASIVPRIAKNCFCPFCGGQYKLNTDNNWEHDVEAPLPSASLLEELRLAREQRVAEQEAAAKKEQERLDINRDHWYLATFILAVVCHIVLIVLLTLFYKGVLPAMPSAVFTLVIFGIAVVLGLLYPSKTERPSFELTCTDDLDGEDPEKIDLLSGFKLSVFAVPACEAVLYFLCYSGFSTVMRFLIQHGMFD